MPRPPKDKAKKPASSQPELSKKDESLWQELASTVKPLGDRPPAPPVKPRRMVRDRLGDQPLADEWYTREGPAPTPQLDRKTRKKLAKGRQDVDRSLDLHGLTQDQAYRLLKSAIEGAVKRGDKTLLVVTGKGGARFSQTGPGAQAQYRTRADFDQFGGVLKRMLPTWLEGPELKPFIESYGEAAKEHGGEGAFYVLLRKRMPGSRGPRGARP